MISHDDMVVFQADSHSLIDSEFPSTIEEYCLHLMHKKAYDVAAKISRGKSVLDLGCNTGYGTKILSNYSKYVIGVDVSPKAIDEAKRLYSSDGIEFQLIDGKKLPFKDRNFDLIVCFQVIEHIVDYKLFLSEVQRVLMPDGIVVFTTPNASLRLDPGMKPWNPFHVREFRAIEFKQMLSNFFTQIKITGMFADEPIYSIEFNRVKRTRAEARIQLNKRLRTYRSFRTQIKKLMPEIVMERIRRIRKSLLGVNDNRDIIKFDKEFIEKYSINNLFYSGTNLERALDLMAVCKM